MSGERWFSERIGGDARVDLRAERVLHESGTGHQHMVLFENPLFGRVLMLDSVIQTTTADEFVYHEMIVHVPVLAHGSARRVLIIGGGDGGSAEEVLKHQSVDRVVQVEIDPSVIEFARTYLSDIHHGAFDDPRLELKIADGARFVAETDERFDVVIVDSTDPSGPSRVLYERPFFEAARRAMTDGGVLVNQCAVPFQDATALRATANGLDGVFADRTAYLASVPAYYAGPMAFGWGSDDPALREVPVETLASRFAAAGFATRYYTPEVHKAAFALPPYIGEIIAG